MKPSLPKPTAADTGQQQRFDLYPSLGLPDTSEKTRSRPVEINRTPEQLRYWEDSVDRAKNALPKESSETYESLVMIPGEVTAVKIGRDKAKTVANLRYAQTFAFKDYYFEKAEYVATDPKHYSGKPDGENTPSQMLRDPSSGRKYRLNPHAVAIWTEVVTLDAGFRQALATAKMESEYVTTGSWQEDQHPLSLFAERNRAQHLAYGNLDYFNLLVAQAVAKNPKSLDLVQRFVQKLASDAERGFRIKGLDSALDRYLELVQQAANEGQLGSSMKRMGRIFDQVIRMIIDDGSKRGEVVRRAMARYELNYPDRPITPADMWITARSEIDGLIRNPQLFKQRVSALTAIDDFGRPMPIGVRRVSQILPRPKKHPRPSV